MKVDRIQSQGDISTPITTLNTVKATQDLQQIDINNNNNKVGVTTEIKPEDINTLAKINAIITDGDIPSVTESELREVNYAVSVTDIYNELQPNFFINATGDITLTISNISSGGGIVNINRNTGNEVITLSGLTVGNHNYPKGVSDIIRLSYYFEQGQVVWVCNNPVLLSETKQTITGTGASNINLSKGHIIDFTFGAQNEELTLSGVDSTPFKFLMKITQDSVGNRTFTYINSLGVEAGSLPVLSTGANDVDLLEFLYDGNTFNIIAIYKDFQIVVGTDNIAPSAPTNLVASNVQNTEIDLTWDAATDNIGVTGYKVYNNGVELVDVGNVTSTTLTGLSQFTEYILTVRAYDAASNESTDSNTQTETTTGISPSAFVIQATTLANGEVVDYNTSPWGNYEYTVDWGDGTVETGKTTNNTNESHTYATAGAYDIVITPEVANGWGGFFGTPTNKTAFTEIKQWGDSELFALSFDGLSNLTITATDTPDFSNSTQFGTVGRLDNIFRDCSSLTSIPNFNTWDFTGIVTLQHGFRNSGLTLAGLSGLENIDTSSIREMDLLFAGTSSLIADFDYSNWDFSSLESASSFISNNGMSSTNYGTLLRKAASQFATIQTGVTLGIANVTYDAGEVDSGTTDGVTVGKLIDSTQNFLTTVSVGDIIHNTVDDTFAKVTAIDSDTQLSIENDIMVNGESYSIQGSVPAKDRYLLTNDYTWNITDGGAS